MAADIRGDSWACDGSPAEEPSSRALAESARSRQPRITGCKSSPGAEPGRSTGDRHVRHQTFDAVNGTAAASFIVATVAGMSVQQWAALLAAVYSLFLIAEKVYVWYRRFKDRKREG